ncbi:DUF2306 domain-containing protein [Rhodobacterales bacterium HKCCE2091]|nr:DUF2306 domain-containing protein [Rhodobacterales bacterium HKCCE2091]
MNTGVFLFYAALVLWVPLFVWSIRSRNWIPFFAYGAIFALILNGRYVVEGMAGGIMFFTGIFDVVSHIGAGDDAAALVPCVDNACTVLTGYETHPSWAVAFYDRFVGGPGGRVALLYGHIIFNTIALVTATIQVFRPGGTHAGHAMIGRVSVVAVVVSLTCAGLLTSELVEVQAYGHLWTTFGLYFLALTALVPVGIGVVAIRRGDSERHRVWMWRYVGAIWGAYWIFRAEMMLIDLLVKDMEGLTLAIPSWTAGLIGIALADLVRRRVDRAKSHGVGAVRPVAAE